MNAGLVMIRCMTHRARHAVLAIICAMPMVLTSSAQAADDDENPRNARLEGYQEPVNVGGGQAGSYVVLGFLGVLTCGILFKNANRSHLD